MDRNLILAVVLSMGVMLFWDLFIAGPQREAYEAARQAEAERVATEEETVEPTLSGLEALTSGEPTVSVEEAIAAAPARAPIRTDNFEGSINLRGARFDDLQLTQYRETIDEDSPIIRLLSPAGTDHGYYAFEGWSVGGDRFDDAEWRLIDGDVLTTETPITIEMEAAGLTFTRTISVDENFMFTIAQSVRNGGAEAVSVTPYASVVQRGFPDDMKNFMILHEGPVGVVGDKLHERKYKKLAKDKSKSIQADGIGGWVGLTGKAWLTAVIPPQDANVRALMTNEGTAAAPVFNSFYALPQRTIAPGETDTLTTNLFAGAKVVKILKGYQAPVDKGGLGIQNFDKAVDWGNFFFLTRPIFTVLNYFGHLTGNYGVSILILTLIIKILLFPIANKGFESLSKMKKLQPEIEKIRARYEDDKMKQQQEMMALYKKENMNPLAGCLPILLQMPIFYALYKTLFVTIELRHEPFVLWIKDLSAPDPTSIFNLFGLLPFDPTAAPLIGAFLGIGVLPILMGVAMWFQTKLNPPPADPTQAQIFAMLPFVFVFIFAPFAAGLVLYWFWNTVLTIVQQYVIMRRNGVEVDLASRFTLPGRKKSPAPGE
ncbi:MAG: membrane protein insertase YidC [Pseudomonadota bacterium]